MRERALAGRDQTVALESSGPMPRIVAQEYFYKPWQALFRSYDLAAYNRVELDIRHPMLDLGCGNGAFGSVFSQFKGLEGIDFGTELDPRSVQQAGRRGLYKGVFRSDARAIPIQSGTLRFVVCNGVLCCIRPGHELALREIARVLRPGGQLVMTVPTPDFTAALLPGRFLTRFGLHTLASRYRIGVDLRNGHRTLQSLEQWRKELETTGLQLEGHAAYFSNSESAWWSIFATRPLQCFLVLRWAPQTLQKVAATFTERLIAFTSTIGRDPQNGGGYLILVARRI